MTKAIWEDFMRPRAARALALDLPLAFAIGVAGWASAQIAQRGGDFDGPGRRGPRPPMDLPSAEPAWPLYPSLALVVVGAALRRLWPRAAFLGVVVGVAGYLAAGGPYGPVLLAPALALHALATALPFQRWAPLALLLPPMLMAGFADQPLFGLLQPALYGAVISGSAVLAIPAMFAVLHRNRRDSERLEREQELRRYAYEERLQIARDVHDVVGHSLSVINLQAGVALHVLHKRPDEVETSLEAIKRTSQEALAELRSTLAVYRDPTTFGPAAPQRRDEPLAPVPGLGRLDDLVAALHAAGREVSLRFEGGGLDVPVPAAVDQAAYRIIQEALTNVVRHAGGAPASVLVSRSRDVLRVEVSDTGTSAGGSSVVEGGGILGMRERAQAVGGTLLVSRSDTGGFRVAADLPLAALSPLYPTGAG